LTQHLTVVSIVFFVVHLVYYHAVSLCGHVAHLITLVGFVEHGTLAIITNAAFGLTVRVEENAETGYADSTKDAENVTLMFVELGWGFATKDEEIIA
jgi:hypothetical protein